MEVTFECVKVVYGSEELALWDIDRIQKISTRSKVPVRAYLCKCGGWHLTSQDKQIDESIATALKIEIAKLEELVNSLGLSEEMKSQKIAQFEYEVEGLKNNEIVLLKDAVRNLNAKNKKLLAANQKLEKTIVKKDKMIIDLNAKMNMYRKSNNEIRSKYHDLIKVESHEDKTGKFKK